ncbi:glycerol-3-phosphate acyltransferase PlsY [Clostridium cavendishii DSM 21758]|uniref:Glycerol-3-phosphate acyltransferase n=1 Tax=Clostridium cavendishii DSM 21758 TaxID=1121302 RepID=A0A1M6IBF4_9CLOT|nr:glycerol-3-phosphate 1-O-acyltransferase PlsY [Clostridium cavendishii]SHJ31747.1 glycerol-3-phosphate acyltransferase PlsY [Clostridium cavendishii DSM 21758]
MNIFLVILGYLMGSIPSGYLLVKYKYGEDIRNLGSGNIGATNVKRNYGKTTGTLIMIFDMLKGLLPVLISDLLFRLDIVNGNKSLVLTLVALAAILGHNYTIFLKFKGGKGVATTVGAFAYILTIPTLIACATFLILKFFIKIVSIRSICLGLALVLSTYFFKFDMEFFYGALIAALLIIVRHKQNIKRLINGEEK